MQHYDCPVFILSWYFYLHIYFMQIKVDGNEFAANNFVQLI